MTKRILWITHTRKREWERKKSPYEIMRFPVKIMRQGKSRIGAVFPDSARQASKTDVPKALPHPDIHRHHSVKDCHHSVTDCHLSVTDCHHEEKDCHHNDTARFCHLLQPYSRKKLEPLLIESQGWIWTIDVASWKKTLRRRKETEQQQQQQQQQLDTSREKRCRKVRFGWPWTEIVFLRLSLYLVELLNKLIHQRKKTKRLSRGQDTHPQTKHVDSGHIDNYTLSNTHMPAHAFWRNQKLTESALKSWWKTIRSQYIHQSIDQ